MPTQKVLKNGSWVRESKLNFDNGTSFERAVGKVLQSGVWETFTLQSIESFEDGDLSEYGGETTYFAVIADAAAPHGSNVLECDLATGTKAIWALPGNGLDGLPSQGDTYSFEMSVTEGTGDSEFWFAVDPLNPSTTRYTIQLHAGNNEISLLRKNPDKTLDTLSHNVVVGSDKYYYFEVSWRTSRDEIIVTPVTPSGNVLQPLAAYDGTFTSGGIGFRSSHHSRWDDLRHTSEELAPTRNTDTGVITDFEINHLLDWGTGAYKFSTPTGGNNGGRYLSHDATGRDEIWSVPAAMSNAKLQDYLYPGDRMRGLMRLPTGTIGGFSFGKSTDSNTDEYTFLMSEPQNKIFLKKSGTTLVEEPHSFTGQRNEWVRFEIYYRYSGDTIECKWDPLGTYGETSTVSAVDTLYTGEGIGVVADGGVDFDWFRKF